MAIPRLQKAASFQEGSPGIRCTIGYSTAPLQKAPCYLFSLPSSKVTGLSKRETEAHADTIVVQWLSRVQLFCDSIDCSPPVSSVHGISQARILKWVAISFSSRHLMSYFLLFPFARFPDSSVGKESACSAGDSSSTPGLGRSSGEGIGSPLQYSWASPVAQLVKKPPAMQETWVRFLGWEDPWRKERLPTPVFWPGEFHGLYSPWGRKESDTTE